MQSSGFRQFCAERKSFPLSFWLADFHGKSMSKGQELGSLIDPPLRGPLAILS
jgi:hypothetical protein